MSPHIAVLFLFLAVFDTAPMALARDGSFGPLRAPPVAASSFPHDGRDVQGGDEADCGESDQHGLATEGDSR
jgi:hypothetical protein